jgi:ABC-type transport system substrate-binding protein
MLLHPARAVPHRRIALLALALLFVAPSGCSIGPHGRTTHIWLAGQAEPPFDPTGPADPLRAALERLTGEGLVAEDTTGRIAEAAARRWDVTPDGLTYTFHLRPGLRFASGRECTSSDFRRALESGLNRVDHGTLAWLLSPIAGVDHVHAGRPLPPLGIATPDPHTLVLKLVRADPTLLHKLALAGVSSAWEPGAANGGWEGGIGPYRLVSREPGRRWKLARRGAGEGPDSIRIEFSVGNGRARAFMRQSRADLVWPVPPGMLVQALPDGYRQAVRAARPTRRLWLVLRHDVPPVSRPSARRALAYGLNRPATLVALGERGNEPGEWPPGAGALDLPPRDPGAVREWLSRARLGRSMHVVMAYAGDGVGAEIARSMQTEWAAAALDVELRPMKRSAFTAEALRRGGAQMLLVEAQPPAEDAVAELAMLVAPRNGPPIGTFRTGWATREFDPWLGPQPPGTPLDLELARSRLGEELTVIPLARLPWLWIERSSGAGVGFHPRYGPGLVPEAAAAAVAHAAP